MTRGWTSIWFSVSALVMWQVQVDAAALSVNDGGPIPPGFETYTLFLIPDEGWISGEKDAELEKLYGDFLQFGHAIGESNLAIWFRKNGTEVDVSRSRKYCDRFGLLYHGPFIVISSKHPDSEMGSEDYYALNLNGIASKRITEILERLGSSIASGTFMWDDTLNTSAISFFRFRYPVKAAIKGPIIEPKKNLRQIIARMNSLPLDEKKLNIQILVVLLATLLASTLLTFKDKRVKLRKQTIGGSATVFFLGVVCYYITYRVLFFEYIGDTLVVLGLTIIYGLIPQRIVEHIPVMKRIVTYTPS